MKYHKPSSPWMPVRAMVAGTLFLAAACSKATSSGTEVPPPDAPVADTMSVAGADTAGRRSVEEPTLPVGAQNSIVEEVQQRVETHTSAADTKSSVIKTSTTNFGRSASESAKCLADLQSRMDQAAEAQASDSINKKKPGSGRDPVKAKSYGWYPKMPEFRDGSLLPCGRIIAYYGHPKSTRMGILGEYPKEEMLRRFKAQVAEWEKADPTTPVIPALHMVSVVAQGEPGRTGRYRTITSDSVVERVYSWAREAGAIFIVDIQVGQDDIRDILPRFEWILKNPDVHLAVDPEFYMRDGVVPGKKIGTMYASDINYVSEYLAGIVKKHNLPPKVLIIHRFTQPMVKNYKDIRLRPEVNFVMHMDGHGLYSGPLLKYDTYRDYVVKEPVQFGGWKNFYKHDTAKGDLPTPADLLRLHPVPLYIQYQ